ncbi:RING finger protein 222 isoform 1-T1 [Discoglossus pictus]
MSSEECNKEPPTNECPVCYERLQAPSISERRLSCGHSFCHDCLVKYLMTAKQEGTIKKNIICPLCRYVTFLSKRGLVLPPKTGELNQILEVPLTPSCLRHIANLDTQNTLVIPITESEEESGPQDLPRCVCQDDSDHEITNHTCGSQIFIISEHGQPLESEEVITTHAQPVDARVNCCRSPALILILLMVFLVAIVSAVLPWILLGRKN